MKFREYGSVHPVVLEDTSARLLEVKINNLGTKRDLIDLQYSTTTNKDGRIHYSALALVRTRKGGE